MLSPQAKSSPFSRTAKLRTAPAAIKDTAAGAVILTALVRLLRVPSPSWPLLLLPTAQTLPSACRKTVWASPADTLRTGSNHATDPRTRTAASRWVAVPSPS